MTDVPRVQALLAKGSQLTSSDVCAHIVADCGVALLGGDCFGLHEGITARLAFVDFDGSAALDALQRMRTNEEPIDMEAFIATYCPSVVEGMEKLSAWLQGRM